jgi:hypothetical protein
LVHVIPQLSGRAGTAPNSHDALRMSHKTSFRTLKSPQAHPGTHVSFLRSNYPPHDYRTRIHPTLWLPPGRTRVSVSHIFSAKARGEELTEFIEAPQTRIRPARWPWPAEVCIHKKCYPYLIPLHKREAYCEIKIASWLVDCEPKLSFSN